MRNTTFTVKRALGLTVASALAFAGTVAVADTSQAAAAAVKLNKSAVSEDGGTVVAVTGKDFQTAAGASKIDHVWLEAGTASSACNLANVAGATSATALSVVSSTKLVFTSPDVHLTTAGVVSSYVVCLSDTGDSNVVGYAKVKTYPTPSISAVSSTSGPTYGGTSVTITGDDFTSKTKALIGGQELTKTKVVIDKTGSSDTITGLVPAGTGTTNSIVVSNEGGDVTSGSTFSYLDAIAVSPAYGDGTADNVVMVEGSGFNSLAFVNTVGTLAAGKSLLTLTDTVNGEFPVGETQANVVTAAPLVCDAVQIVNDTELTCELPDLSAAAAQGAYNIQLITSDGTNLTTATVVSRGSTYTVAAF